MGAKWLDALSPHFGLLALLVCGVGAIAFC